MAEKTMGLKTDNDDQDDNSPLELGTTGLSPDKKDANDMKIMAQTSGDKPGRSQPASLQTYNGMENSDIKYYYEFPSSKTKSYNTYPERVEKIGSFLGNKDSVKG